MKISVIIPHINREEVLTFCLEALKMQTFPKEDYEVVIAGSMQETEEDSFGFHLKYVPYNLEAGEKFPASKLRNLGAEKAEGDILIFLDCDIVIPPDFLAKTWETLGKERKLIFTLRKRIPENAEVKQLKDLKRIKCEKDEREQVCSLFESDYSQIKSIWLWVYSHTMCMWRDDFKKSGGFSEKFSGWGLEDTEFSYRIYKMGIPIVCDSKSKCYHLWHPDIYDGNRYKGYKANLEQFHSMHSESVLNGLDICAECFSPSRILKLVKLNIPPAVYLLSMFECFVRGYESCALKGEEEC